MLRSEEDLGALERMIPNPNSNEVIEEFKKKKNPRGILLFNCPFTENERSKYVC